MKAYSFGESLIDRVYYAEHYQDLSAQWHEIANGDDIDAVMFAQQRRAQTASIARYKMGLREADYDWESHAG